MNEHELLLRKNYRLNKPEQLHQKELLHIKLRKNTEIKNTGTCLGDCVICGASCCLDAGHPGPHFCYLHL